MATVFISRSSSYSFYRMTSFLLPFFMTILIRCEILQSVPFPEDHLAWPTGQALGSEQSPFDPSKPSDASRSNQIISPRPSPCAGGPTVSRRIGTAHGSGLWASPDHSYLSMRVCMCVWFWWLLIILGVWPGSCEIPYSKQISYD